MKRLTLSILLSFTFFLSVMGQEPAPIQRLDSVAATPVRKPSALVRAWNWFSRWRDKAQLSGYEPGYVGYPKGLPWVAGLYGYMALTNVDMHLPDLTDGSYFDVYNTTGLSSKLSAGIYYTGWGISFGPRLSNKSNFYFDFSSYGRVFGFDIKLDNYKNLHSRIKWETPDVNTPLDGTLRGLMGPEMLLLKLNTYFVFNARKFSYASALSQTTWQRRSAGSLIAGLTYTALYTGYDDEFFKQMNISHPYYADTLHFLSHNMLAGIGYAYNKVWKDGRWMLHASLLPMVRWSFYNSIDITPHGDLSDWPEQYRQRYEQKASELKLNAAAQRVSLAAIARVAAFWNISTRWVAGATCTVSNYWGGYRDGIKLTNFDAISMIYGAYRF